VEDEEEAAAAMEAEVERAAGAVEAAVEICSAVVVTEERARSRQQGSGDTS
jgi:hypothetical protein